MPISPCRAALLPLGAIHCSQALGAQADACAQHAAASKTMSPPHGEKARSAKGASSFSLRLDNDVFGDQDQGYSNGIQLMLASSDLADIGTCRWPVTDWFARRLRFLAPPGSDQQNLTFSLGQAIFTPSNRRWTEVIPDDRPYAAALLAGIGYNARVGERLQTTLVQVGIVGPSARGRQAQDTIHKITGDDPFLGWDNQLGDEGVFRIVHERLQRHRLGAAVPGPVGSWRRDAISHWGASFGNLLTNAGIGGELRWGPTLPDDFGSSPTRPAGERTIGRRGEGVAAFAAGLSGHGFVALDARWVLWDISLDGNAFRDSHGVDKRNFVADLGYGIALTRGPWKLVIARFHRTREFRGQKDRPVFGSISVSRSF